jgi:LysM repeat protein
MKKSLCFTLLGLLTAGIALAHQPTTAATYITTWKDEAVFQMAMYKIPASITLAQGMLESGNGNSRLATQANNHFGIKCHSDWSGKKIYEDDETRNECFRHYNDASESFADHSVFLQKARYKPLFELKPDDYEGWAHGLKECGYATNPKYPQLLIKLIKEHGLAEYDEIGMRYIRSGELPKHNSAPMATANTAPAKKSADVPAEITIGNGRKVNPGPNNIPCVVAGKDDTIERIAQDFDLNPAFIRSFNDFEKNHRIEEGDVVFVKPKRGHCSDKTYKVKSGDTMWAISQKTGIKLRKLRKFNHFTTGVEPEIGTVLRLQRKWK